MKASAPWSTPLYQLHGRYVLPNSTAAPVQGITRAEINVFWMKKKQEEDEYLFTAEKEAARIKAQTLKQEDYMLFEQMINGIIHETNERGTVMWEGDITKDREAVITRKNEIGSGIKDWWRKSSYAYLNEPIVPFMDENNSSKDTITYIPQNIHLGCCSPAP